MTEVVGLEQIRQAERAIREVVRRTPLLPADRTPYGPHEALRLKCENLQRGGSFKLRGAYNFMRRMPADRRSRGVVTYSSGNHGRAVALAARELGVKAVVVVPTDAPRVKVDGIRNLGAEVVAEGTTSVERQRHALALAEERGLEVVPPFDHPDIIAGQGSVGLEIMEDWPEVARVLVPIGGGGLVSGVAAALAALAPDVRVYGVEPAGAASMRRSIEADRPVELESVRTVADGLKPVRPGDLTFEHVRRYVTEIVTVEDDDILRAMVWCARECRLVVEPSGAAALAALDIEPFAVDRTTPTVVILSGGNVELGRLAELDASAAPGASVR